MKPMLSATAGDLADLRYPLLASPKLDGVRALVVGGVLVTRNLTPVLNRELQARYGHRAYNGLDGELCAGLCTDPGVFQLTSSIVRSRDKIADSVYFHVFDNWQAAGPFTARFDTLEDSMERGIIVVPHTPIKNGVALGRYEEGMVGRGYEGVMTRDPQGGYKWGRSTLAEQGLVKVKRFQDDEAVILEVIEGQQNTNVAEKDALGQAKRSTHKAGMVGKGCVGAFRVQALTGPYKGKEFFVGAGTLTAEERKRYWGNLPAKVLTFKYFPTGSKDIPRFPLFLRWA